MKCLGIIFASLFLLGCGPGQDQIGYGQTEQEFNSNPPPRMVCDYPMEACGGKVCANLQWDINNCGVCGNECDRGSGEICHNFQCKSIEVFGFDSEILNRGPVEYNPKKDLPRPNPVQTKH